MTKKTPPYRKIGGVFSLVLLALAAYGRFIVNDDLAGWMLGLMVFSSLVVLLMAILEISLLIVDFRRGHLFPMKNASLFLAVFTVLALPLLAIYKVFFGEGMDLWVYLYPILLFVLPQSVMNVRMNDILLETKTGVAEPVVVPLFSIQKVSEDDDGITVLTNEEKEISLLRQFFFAGNYQLLRDRLMGLNPEMKTGAPSISKTDKDGWSAYQGVAGFGVAVQRQEEE